MFGKHKAEFKELRVSNLIEFGRMVHAEMFALMEAARRGLSVEGGKLYCTTFPCHMCARHIIAAGLNEVIYIEPYPKSMTAELYKDIIEIDVDPSQIEVNNGSCKKNVFFQPFHGIAPKIYSDAFTMPSRKDEKGYRLAFEEKSAIPKWIPLTTSHLNRELTYSENLDNLPKVAESGILGNGGA